MDLSGIAPAQAPPDLLTHHDEGARPVASEGRLKTVRHPAGVHRRFQEVRYGRTVPAQMYRCISAGYNLDPFEGDMSRVDAEALRSGGFRLLEQQLPIRAPYADAGNGGAVAFRDMFRQRADVARKVFTAGFRLHTAHVDSVPEAVRELQHDTACPGHLGQRQEETQQQMHGYAGVTMQVIEAFERGNPAAGLPLAHHGRMYM